MEKFEYKGTEFNIIESCDTHGHESWQKGQLKESDRTVIRTIFTFEPLWIGKKFRWFKKCRVRYRLCFTRTEQFDDGWTYQHYWTKWKHSFKPIEILN